MLWGNEGRLLGIELYEQDQVADRFPTIECLRRWVISVAEREREAKTAP